MSNQTHNDRDRALRYRLWFGVVLVAAFLLLGIIANMDAFLTGLLGY